MKTTKNKNCSSIPKWERLTDKDENDVWSAQSPLADCFGFPYFWRLKQKIKDNIVVWVENHDEEVVPKVEQDYVWTSLVEAKQVIQKEHQLIMEEVLADEQDELTIRVSDTKDDSEINIILNIEDDSSDVLQTFITETEARELYENLGKILSIYEKQDVKTDPLTGTLPTSIDYFALLKELIEENKKYPLWKDQIFVPQQGFDYLGQKCCKQPVYKSNVNCCTPKDVVAEKQTLGFNKFQCGDL